MIYFFTPYDFNGNLGKAYNQYMNLIGDDDWGVFFDGDAMFLTPDWGHQIKEVIDKYPDAGMITCVTNRISNQYQRVICQTTDILEHKKRASQRERSRRGEAKETGRHISGIMIAISKKVWKEYPAPEIGTVLNVDNVWSRTILRAKKKIYIADGIYMLHYYRWAEGRASTSHIGGKQKPRPKRKKRVLKRPVK